MAETLDRLAPGERGTVAQIALGPMRAASLTRLGLCPGTEIRCLRRAPLGGPTIYRFRGTDVALRQKDAAGIQMQIESARCDQKNIQKNDSKERVLCR